MKLGLNLLAVATTAAVAIAVPARDAHAFCGFYVSGADATLTNDATLVVMMRDGERTVLSMRNTYAGPPEDFAMVVPVPVVLRESNVKVIPRDIFDNVDRLTAPRLVEYWEQDPCMQPVYPEESVAMAPMAAPAGAATEDESAAKHHVKIEARFAVGEYDVVVLSASDSAGLDAWLHENRYKIPAGAEPYLRPYVQMGMKFFVAKVNVAKVKFERIGGGPERAVLSPLRFHYDAPDFFLPVRLGLINSGGKQDLVAIILSRSGRYEVANYDNVAMPTNLEVADGVRRQFGAFYASLYDKVVGDDPRAVVTEYAWEATSCDPCPTPPLDDGELATLGADVLPDDSQGSGFVITRLHARYGRDTLGDDLYFRPARPITGGREGMGTTAQDSGGNDFQARYVIRHRWTGPVACEHPQWNVWGGPPDGHDSSPVAAMDLAFAARDVDVASLVKGSLPDGMSLSKGTPSGPPRIPPTGGCAGCSAAPGAEDYATAGLFALGFLVMTRKRRN
jgi:MYXO-CTERM domain-containing protein